MSLKLNKEVKDKKVEDKLPKLMVLFFILAGFTVLYYLSPILTPFLFGAILTYLCNPIVDQLMRLKLSRTVAVVIVFVTLFVIFTLLIILIVPLLEEQAISFINQMPNMLAWLDNKALPLISSQLGLDLTRSFPKLSALPSEGIIKAGHSLFQTMVHSGKTFFEWLLNLILIPVVTFYLLRDWPNIIKNIHHLVPKHMEPTFSKLSKECDSVLSGFLRGQLLVMLTLGIYYAITLNFMGLQLGIVIGLITGLISIVPYLGMVVGIILASITALMQFGTITSILWVLLIFIIGHGLENAYLSPKLIGERVGLHPLAVIFAILAGGKIFGFFGILLALPVTAVTMVLIRFLIRRYRQSRFYTERA